MNKILSKFIVAAAIIVMLCYVTLQLLSQVVFLNITDNALAILGFVNLGAVIVCTGIVVNKLNELQKQINSDKSDEM